MVPGQPVAPPATVARDPTDGVGRKALAEKPDGQTGQSFRESFGRKNGEYGSNHPRDTQPRCVSRGRGGRIVHETSSRATILNEFEIHLRVNLLGLCHSLFPSSTQQLVMFTMEGAEEIWGEVSIWKRRRVAGEVNSEGTIDSFTPSDSRAWIVKKPRTRP